MRRTGKKKMVLRRMIRSLSIAVIILTFCLTVLLYRSFYQGFYEKILTTNETILNAVSVPVEDNEKMVENTIELLCYDYNVISLLKKNTNVQSETVQQVFDIQKLIAEREFLLSKLGGDIIIFSNNEFIPASFWYILPTTKAQEMEGYNQFISTGEIDGWTSEEYIYPESTVISDNNRQMMISYYRLITDSVSNRLGVIKCGILKERFLEALSSADIDGQLFVAQGNSIIYGDASGIDISEIPCDKNRRYEIGHMVYITHPLQKINMNLVIALDKRNIFCQAAVCCLPQLLIILGMGIIMITVNKSLTHSIYRRIDQVVDVAKEAKQNYMDVKLPNSDDDDINVLIDAFNTLIQQINDSARRQIRHEQREKSALRLALQYQMNPHFLFNTLNWIQMCIELGTEPEKISEGIVVLGRLLRYNLNGESYASVCQEIERTRDYVYLMNMRKNNAVSLNICMYGIDNEQRIMRFLLQPLCENAIQHGLIPGKHLNIEVMISKEENEITIVVENDGKMIEPERIEEIMNKVRHEQGESGVGLANIYSRIKLLYGDSSNLEIESKEEMTRIIIKFKVSNALVISEGDI